MENNHNAPQAEIQYSIWNTRTKDQSKVLENTLVTNNSAFKSKGSENQEKPQS